MNSLAKHSAAPQLAGYVFQLERALYRLASSPTALGVGVETLDDVVVSDANGVLVCEQDKTTSSNGAEPLADRRRGLWSALSVWADAIATNELDPSAAEFHLVTNADLGTGLAYTLSLVQGDGPRASAAVAALRTYAPSLPASVRLFADRLLAHPDSVLTSMIKLVRCYSKQDATSGAALRAQMAVQLRIAGSPATDDILNGLLGWLHNEVVSRIFAGERAWIPTAAFNNQFQALVERNRRRRFRELPASQVLVTDDERAANSGCVFVEQLALIGAQDDELTDAVDDFIRFGRERLRLSHEGDIPDDEWSAFDGRLVDHWKPIFRPHRHAPDDQCQALGRQIYSTVQCHRELLAGYHTSEFYITRGAYHRLADGLHVGWHPKFHDRLTKEAP